MRRAAGEGLALLATKMGTAYQAQLLQQLVETLQHANRGILGHDHGGSSGSGKGSGGGHRGSMGSNWDEADITTGAVFARLRGGFRESRQTGGPPSSAAPPSPRPSGDPPGRPGAPQDA